MHGEVDQRISRSRHLVYLSSSYGTQRVSIRLRRIEFNEGSPTCTLLRSFQPPYAITTLALRKNQIAFALWDVPVTVVCDWTKSRDDAFFGQSVQDTEQPNWRVRLASPFRHVVALNMKTSTQSDIVRLLPGSQLLVLQGLSVRIHDISSLDTTLYHVDAAPIQSTAVWSFSAHDSFAIHNFIRAGPKIGRVQIHEFSKDDNNLRHASCLFSFSTLVEHFRFWIPRRNGQVPSAIDYMHLPGRAQYSSSMIGTFRGLSLDEGHNFNLLSYAEELRYPDNAMPYSKCNSSVIRQVPLGTIYHDTEHLYLGGLDEFSGRACLVFTSGWGLPSKSIDVFDFAP